MKSVEYRWNLRGLMAGRGMYSTTKLIPLLRERGIELSSSQIYRLASERPDRLNLYVFAALIDIFECSAGDLFQVERLPVVVATGTDPQRVQSTASEAIKSRNLRPPRSIVDPSGLEG